MGQLVACATCDRRFRRGPREGRKRYCSPSCYSRSRQHECPDCGRLVYGNRCGSCCQRGERNSEWNGGRTVSKQGYVKVKAREHPHADLHGYVAEHRLVMEQMLGRFLAPRREQVHHRNGNKADNRPSNLELMTIEEHSYHHNRRPDLVPDKPCDMCGRIFKARRRLERGKVARFCSAHCTRKARSAGKINTWPPRRARSGAPREGVPMTRT